jgi:hypoxanthine phosphoribosyltransferase
LTSEAEFEVPTWNQVHDMLFSQAEKIRQSGFKPDVIVGITRGGWVPSRVLSDLLDTPSLATVRVKFYVGVAQTTNEPVLTQGLSMTVAGENALVVDEVADTGKSLALAKAHVLQQGAKEARTATLYVKPWSTFKPDYYEKETRLWVVFPWETKETISKIVEKHKGKAAVERETAKLVKAGLPEHLADRYLKEVLEERRDC